MKTILFDIGGVILPEEDLYAAFLEQTRQTICDAGIRISNDEFNNAVCRCILSFVPSLRKALIWYFTQPDMDKYSAIANAITWSDVQCKRIPRPGIFDLLQNLSKRCTLALAANAGGSIRNILEEENLLQFFKSIEVSGDLLFSKPDPRFFEHILNNCNASPEDTIMIGDRLDNDIIPAKLLGMKTLLYKTGPYSILEPRTPEEIPDHTVTSILELHSTLIHLLS